MKKIFTLIAVAAMALGANAQTTISLAGLKTTDFTYDAAAYEVSTWTDSGDPSITAPAFTKKGTNVLEALTLTGKDVAFWYKSGSDKTNFFILCGDYFTVGGKGAQLKISNVKKGQTITLNVAAKADYAASPYPEFAVEGATVEGELPVLSVKNQFTDITLTATADGDVTIKENQKGYNIHSITIADGAVIPSTSESVILDAATAAEKEALAYERTSADGNVKVAIAKVAKFDSSKGPQMKVASTLDVETPAGTSITNVTFTIGGSSSAGKCYWTANGTKLSNSAYKFKDEAQSWDFASTGNKIAFVVGNDEAADAVFYMSKVDVTYISATGIETTTVIKNYANGVAYNLSGQKVGDDYKGIVIINGKKMLRK